MRSSSRSFSLLLLCLITTFGVSAFHIPPTFHGVMTKRSNPLQAYFMEEKEATATDVQDVSITPQTSAVAIEEISQKAEETTEKYGLEAGLFQSIKSGDGESAKSLLKKYGVAYLATSIPLALLSFGICYLLVDQGVDVASLLAKVGIESSTTSETAGTVAIAYAAHKAASPIRFPPTVLLTPIVAKWIGKEPETEQEKEN